MGASLVRVLLVIGLLPSAAMAQVQLDRLFPPVVSPGQSVLVKAEGKFPTWPVEFTADRDDVLVTAGDKPGDVQIELPAECRQGVVWIRAADALAVTSARPLLIEPLNTMPEVEPNGLPGEATPLPLPASVAGRLSKSNDVDTFRVQLRRGEKLVVSMMAHEILRSPMDAVLQICDRHGNVLLQADDERGLDPQLVYECPEDGQRFLRVFAFPETPNSTIGFAGGESFSYVLRVSTGPMVDHFLPMFPAADTGHPAAATLYRHFGWNLDSGLEPDLLAATEISPQSVHSRELPGWQWLPRPEDFGAADIKADQFYFDSASGSTQITTPLPALCSGHISAPGEVDCFRLQLIKGTRLRCQVFSRRLGFQLDSVLRLVDPATGEVLSQNDDRSRREYDALLDYVAKGDGEVELQISDVAESAGMRHAYSIMLAEIVPSVAIRSARDVFSVAAGKQVDVPVTIDRRDGFSEALKISATGLPPAVSCEPVVSEAKGESSKSVNLQLKVAADAGSQRMSFQIIYAAEIMQQADNEDASEVEAKVTSSSAKESKIRSCLFELRPRVFVREFWLTIKPLEESAE